MSFQAARIFSDSLARDFFHMWKVGGRARQFISWSSMTHGYFRTCGNHHLIEEHLQETHPSPGLLSTYSTKLPHVILQVSEQAREWMSMDGPWEKNYFPRGGKEREVLAQGWKGSMKARRANHRDQEELKSSYWKAFLYSGRNDPGKGNFLKNCCKESVEEKNGLE